MVSHSAIQFGIINAEGENIVADTGGKGDLLGNFVGGNGVFADDDHKCVGTFNGRGNTGGPVRRGNIPGCDETPQPPLLNIVAYRFCNMQICAVIADENIIMHSRFPLFCVIFIVSPV